MKKKNNPIVLHPLETRFLLDGAAPISFGPSHTYISGHDVVSVAAADLNGDGIPDLVTIDNYDTVNVLMGNGDGTFKAPTTIYTGNDTLPAPHGIDIACADVTGDGKQDIIAVDSAEQTLFLFLGT